MKSCESVLFSAGRILFLQGKTMANICDFDMLVRGKPENVDTFYRYLTDYDNSPKYFARIFTAEIDNESVSAEEIKTAKIFGECAWSVYSCMCEGEYTYYKDGSEQKLTCLRLATQELNLEVEIRSTESGMGFWEHIQYKDGECLCEDCGDLPESKFKMEDAA